MTQVAEKINKSTKAGKWDAAYIDALPDSAFAWTGDSGERKLPYKDSDGKVDLPHLRNALARLNQTQGPSAEEKTSIKTKLENALMKNKPQAARTYSAVLADVATSQLPTKIMLLRSGTFNTSKYGEMELTPDDLQEMADNFENGVGLNYDGSTGAPINYAHQDHLEAAAWIKGLVVEPDEDGVALYADPVEWTTSGQAAVSGGMYKYISSEFFPACFGAWSDYENSGITAQNVFEGAALTNIPMFTGLKPVAASKSSDGGIERGNVIVIKASKKETNMPTLDEVVKIATDQLTEEQKTFLAEHKDELTDEQKATFGFEVKATKVDEKEEVDEEAKALAARVKSGEAVVIEASRLKALEDMREEYQLDKAKQIVMSHVKRGAIKADAIDAWASKIVADKSTEDLLKSIPDNQLLAGELGTEHADDEIDERDRLVSAAKTIAGEKNIPIQEAIPLAQKQLKEAEAK